MRPGTGGTLILPAAASVFIHAAILLALRVEGPTDAGDRGQEMRLTFVGLVGLAAAEEERPPEAVHESPRERAHAPPRIEERPPAEQLTEEPAPARAVPAVHRDDAREETTEPEREQEPQPEQKPEEDPRREEPREATTGPTSEPSPGQLETPGSALAAAGAQEEARERYLKDVLRKLHAAKRYPGQSRWRREEGTVEVTFTIARDGRVAEAVVAAGSSHALLDAEALAMVARAAPFGPLPEEVDRDRWKITVPIRFEILPAR